MASDVELVWKDHALNTLLRGTDGETARDLVRRANSVAQRARELAPVNSGALRSSIQVGSVEQVGNDLAVPVEATVHYAVYVERGTSRMAPRPFLSRAVQAAAD